FTGNLAGLQNGDTITASCTSPATPSSPLGNYAITPTLNDPTSKLGNYTVTVKNGALTILPAALSVTADDARRGYGAANPTLTGSLTGLLNGDAITANYGTPASAASVVGSYAIMATLSDPANKLANYNVTVTAGTLTILPVVLTITADDKNRSYGQA